METDQIFLIKIKNTFYITDNSEIKNGDKYENGGYLYIADEFYQPASKDRKVILIPLSEQVEVEKLVYGYSVEELAHKNALIYKDAITSMVSYIEGFNTHKEFTKERLFTKSDLIDFAEKCLIVANDTDNIGRLRKFVIKQAESLNQKTEWQVVIDDNGKIFLKD